jgi:hypothetical protein
LSPATSAIARYRPPSLEGFRTVVPRRSRDGTSFLK